MSKKIESERTKRSKFQWFNGFNWSSNGLMVHWNIEVPMVLIGSSGSYIWSMVKSLSSSSGLDLDPFQHLNTHCAFSHSARLPWGKEKFAGSLALQLSHGTSTIIFLWKFHENTIPSIAFCAMNTFNKLSHWPYFHKWRIDPTRTSPQGLGLANYTRHRNRLAGHLLVDV